MSKLITLDNLSAYNAKAEAIFATKASQGVTNLGEIPSSPGLYSADCAELNAVQEPGAYRFMCNSMVYIMHVHNFGTSGMQYISSGDNSYTARTWASNGWNVSSYYPASSDSVTTAQKYAASGNTSSKIYLVGRTSQSSTGGQTYSHDTVYVDTSGRMCGTAGVYTNKMYAPTSSGSSSYGVGSAGQVLMSNGTSTYWGDLP
jgi:hypothetical protein